MRIDNRWILLAVVMPACRDSDAWPRPAAPCRAVPGRCPVSPRPPPVTAAAYPRGREAAALAGPGSCMTHRPRAPGSSLRRRPGPAGRPLVCDCRWPVVCVSCSLVYPILCDPGTSGPGPAGPGPRPAEPLRDSAGRRALQPRPRLGQGARGVASPRAPAAYPAPIVRVVGPAPVRRLLAKRLVRAQAGRAGPGVGVHGVAVVTPVVTARNDDLGKQQGRFQ